MPKSFTSSSSVITIGQLACCADDSYDRGSCRIRLTPSVWAAAGIAYHKPVVVSISCDGFSQPWRLLCVSALTQEEDCLAGASAAKPNRPSPLGPAVAFAVVDPTVVVPPPGADLSQLRDVLRSTAAASGAAAAGAQVEVMACRGAGVPAAGEVQLRVPPSLEHLVSPPTLAFKLHQTMVLPGCWVRMSDSCAMRVEAAQPASSSAASSTSTSGSRKPTSSSSFMYPDQPLRVVPSTRLVLAESQEALAAASREEGTRHQGIPGAYVAASRLLSGPEPAEGSMKGMDRGRVEGKERDGEGEDLGTAASEPEASAAGDDLGKRKGDDGDVGGKGSKSSGKATEKGRGRGGPRTPVCDKVDMDEGAGVSSGPVRVPGPVPTTSTTTGGEDVGAGAGDAGSEAESSMGACSAGKAKGKAPGRPRAKATTVREPGDDDPSSAAAAPKASTAAEVEGAKAAQTTKVGKASGKAVGKSSKGSKAKGQGITASASAFDALMGLMDDDE